MIFKGQAGRIFSPLTKCFEIYSVFQLPHPKKKKIISSWKCPQSQPKTIWTLHATLRLVACQFLKINFTPFPKKIYHAPKKHQNFFKPQTYFLFILITISPKNVYNTKMRDKISKKITASYLEKLNLLKNSTNFPDLK